MSDIPRRFATDAEIRCPLTFKSWRCFLGPIPDNMRICGLPIVPAERMISLRARAWSLVPFRVYWTPTALFPLKMTWENSKEKCWRVCLHIGCGVFCSEVLFVKTYFVHVSICGDLKIWTVDHWSEESFDGTWPWATKCCDLRSHNTCVARNLQHEYWYSADMSFHQTDHSQLLEVCPLDCANNLPSCSSPLRSLSL